MKNRLTPASILIFSLVAEAAQFGVAAMVLGGWKAFFSHPALIALTLATLGMLFVAPFSNVNLSSGEKEDRANRWVFTAFGLIALTERHRAALYRSHRPVDHRRRNNSLDRRDPVRARRSTATVAGLCAGFAIQWVGGHPVGPHAGNTRHLQPCSQPQLPGNDYQHAGMGTGVSRLVGRSGCFATVGAAHPTHSLRRAPSGGAVRCRIRCLCRANLAADSGDLLIQSLRRLGWGSGFRVNHRPTGNHWSSIDEGLTDGFGDHPTRNSQDGTEFELETCLRLFSSTQDHDQEDR